MIGNIINEIALDLIKLEKNPKLSITNPKIYFLNGLILESYAKLQKISKFELEKLIKNNSFFKIGKTTQQTGLFTKKDKIVPTIEWETDDELKKNYILNPDKILKESAESETLLLRTIRLINECKPKIEIQPRSDSVKLEYNYPQNDRTKLYTRYFPEELLRYQREGKFESDLEKKFKTRVPKGSEFHFSDGKVAHNLLTWIQCLQMAPNDVIVSHILNNDFYDWLESKVKVPELARICYSITNKVKANEQNEKEIKIELLRNINKTSLNNIIYESLITPLLRTLKSDDQTKAIDAVDKLVNIGDERIVEPLTEKLFDSSSQLRQKLISGLGKLGDIRATPALIKIIKHTNNTQERLLAIKTLGVLSDKRSIKILKEFSKEKGEIGIESKKLLESMHEKFRKL